MSVTESEFKRVADALAVCGHDTCTLSMATISNAHRVGRNAVWRLDSSAGNAVAYLKFATDSRWYSRELYGYEIASNMSRESEYSSSADVLFACSTRRCLATSPICGTPVSEVFKSAYRIDKNPLRRRVKTMEACSAIEGVVRWLRQFHQQPVPAHVDLYDHRPSNASRRLQKLLRTQPDEKDERTLADIIGVSAGEVPSLTNEGVCSKVIFGDVTLGNFFWHNKKIGAIDFEDIGVGEVARDFMTLRADILRPLENFYYFSDCQLQEILSDPASSSHSRAYELETVLHRCVHDCQTRSRAKVSYRYSERIRQLISNIADSIVRT